MHIIFIISLLLFLSISFFFTQKIYSLNYFFPALLLSIVICFLFLFIGQKDLVTISKLNVGALILYNIILLFLVKKTYKKINNFLIKKKMLKEDFRDKDFTYVVWDGDMATMDSIWDKKLTTSPSWFDYSITILLLVSPVVIMLLVNELW